MRPQTLALRRDQTVFSGFHDNISELAGKPLPPAFSGNYIRHFTHFFPPARSSSLHSSFFFSCFVLYRVFRRFDESVQIQKSAALRKSRHITPYRTTNLRPHVFIALQLFGVKLRITAAEKQSVHVCRKTPVPKRTERDQLRAQTFQQREI